jgi:hypothetical protein
VHAVLARIGSTPDPAFGVEEVNANPPASPLVVTASIGNATAPPPDLPNMRLAAFETANDQSTDQIVEELNYATAYCSVI